MANQKPRRKYPPQASPHPLTPHAATSQRTISHRQIFQGPFPPPVVLQQYEQIVPGASERILAMGEKQQEHRIQMEKTVIQADIQSRNKGMNYALTLALSFLMASVYLISQGHEISGAVLGTVDLVSLVAVFITGKESQKAERLEKHQRMTSRNPSPPQKQ